MGLAWESLAAAGHLARGGFYAAATSRAYYAAFYAARAAVRSSGSNPSTHRGVSVEFSRLWVHTSRVPPDVNRTLRRLMAAREEADYDEDAVPPDRARQALRDARGVVEAVAAALGSPPPALPYWADYSDDQKRDLAAQLTREMDAAAEALEFEKAAEIRDSIAQIEADLAA